MVAALGRAAAAEINVADTVEWMTADADRVVVGTIADVKLTPGADNTNWTTATVDVASTIKGAAAKRLTFVAQTGPTGVPAAWRGAELLIFLERADRRAHDTACARACHYDLAPWTPRTGANSEGVVVLDAKAGEEVYTSAFTALRARADVLAATTAAASSKATRSIHVDAPDDSAAFHALYGGSSVWIIVPVDAALEQRAHTWIASPDVSQRVLGVRVLAEFKTAANIRRLKALLTDAGFAMVTERGKPPVRRYLVRAPADAALRTWKVAHATPIIDEVVPTAPPVPAAPTAP